MKKISIGLLITLLAASVFAQEKSKVLTKEKVDELCAVISMTRNTITEFTVPNAYTIIGEGAFEECKKLENINLPQNITKIEKHAFSATHIKELSIPETIDSIENAFGHCYNLKSITVYSKTPPKLQGQYNGNTDSFYTSLGKKIIVYVPDDCIDLYKTTWKENEYSYFHIEPISSKETSRNDNNIGEVKKTVSELHGNNDLSSETADVDSTAKADTNNDDMKASDWLLFIFLTILLVLCIKMIRKGLKMLKNKKSDDEKNKQNNEKGGFLSSTIKKLTTDERMDELDKGNLPIENSGNVILANDEICHFHSSVTYIKVRERVIGYKGGGTGVSFRIAKGISIHTGSDNKKAVRGNVVQEEKGSLTITNKRIIGSAFNVSFDKKISSLSSIESNWNAVLLQFGKEQYYFKTFEAIYIDKIIRLAARNSD